jgi:hypothetical protein
LGESSHDDSTLSSSASWLDEESSDHGNGNIPDADGYGGDDEAELSSHGGSSDDEWSGESDTDEVGGPGERVRLARWVRETIEAMYTHRYEVPQNQLPHGPGYLHHVPTVQKNQWPDHFHHALRVIPATFDRIIKKILDDPIFFNRSDQQQLSVEERLTVTLYQFGHDGNAAGLQAVANWAGLSKETVSLVTH